MKHPWQIMVLGPLVAGVFALPAAAQQPQPPLGVAPGQVAPADQPRQPAVPQPRINPGELGVVPMPPGPSEPGPSLGSPPHLPQGLESRQPGGSAPGFGPSTPSSSTTPGASGAMGGTGGGMGAGGGMGGGGR